MREKKRLEEMLATEADLVRRGDDIAAYFELAREGENVEADLRKDIDALRQQVELLETETLLSGENDMLSAIVTIHPGAGGTESQDWADMLLRMYLRWAERQGFQTVLNDYQPGEEAGLKSATFTVTGEYAYGLLTSEIGVHRLVRISPFDQAKRRHTSFASVYVSPEIDESIEDSKLDIDFGSQIRSYVLQPYRMVKDHRTKVEVGDVDRVIDGDLRPFISAYLRMRRDEKGS